MSGDGIPLFQKRALRFDAPGTVRLEFTSALQPESVAIIVARELRERARMATGPRKWKTYRLEPITDEAGAVTAWAAVFRLAKERHHYVNVRGTWRDPRGCGGTVSWVLYLQGV